MNRRNFLNASVVLALKATQPDGVIHLLFDVVKADISSFSDSGNKRTVVMIIRISKFYDPRYGASIESSK